MGDMGKERMIITTRVERTELAPEPEAFGVSFVPVRCPRCGSKRCPVYSSAPPVRYHRCECGNTFKSIEE